MELGQWNLAHWNFGELWRIGNKGINKGRALLWHVGSLRTGGEGTTRGQGWSGISAPDTISRDHKPEEDRRAVHRSRQGQRR
jgi:hypothetical protein